MEQLLDLFWTQVVPVLLLILSGLIAKYLIPLLKSYAKRLGIEIDSREEAKIQFPVEQAIKYAEETVEARYKDKLYAAGMKGEAKLAIAVAGVIDDIPGISATRAEMLVKAALAGLGLGATKSVPFLVETLKKQAASLTPPSE